MKTSVTMRTRLATRGVMGALIVSCAIAGNALALEPYFVDFRKEVEIFYPNEPTFENTGFHGPTGGCPASAGNCGFFIDYVEVVSDHPGAIAAVGFAFQESLTDGTMDITTIYGVDLDPQANVDLVAGGFDASRPELVFRNERFVGLTQEYEGESLGAVSVGDLSATFPDFDLSPFGSAAAGSNDIVYAFRTNVDPSDFAFVPEPSTAIGALLAIGATAGIRGRPRS